MEVKNVKAKLPWITLIGAISVFVLGLILLFLQKIYVEALLIVAVTVVLLIFGVTRLVSSIRIKEFSSGIMFFVFCWTFAGLLNYADYSIDSVAVLPSIIVGSVSLLLGIMRLLILINCIVNKYQGVFRNGISAVLCIAFGLFLVIRPIENFELLAFVAGFYLIFYAVTMFGDFFASVFRVDLNENRTKRRVHHALPNIFTAVKPSNMITEINKKIELGEVKSGVIVENKLNTDFTDVNLEILVHLTTQGANKFGHVDIAMGDTIYSYGTYDSSADRMGGFVSQGTFIDVPKVPYLKYCLNHQKKYVIGFGAALSDVQYQAVQKKIDEFFTNCEPFESNYEKAIKENKDGSEFTDPASNIVRDVGGKVYTVTKGPFRRYFGINTNCVRVADWLLSDSGIDAISFSSLSTPGSYYSMLQNMFRRKNTRIIRKTTYIFADDIEE